jgi:hypothetical protein
VDFSGEGVEGLGGAEAVEAGLAVAVLNALHEAGLADFNVFIEVGAGDGEELDAFKQGVGRVFGFFQDTSIELHPGVVASVEELLFLRSSSHGRNLRRVGESTAFGRGLAPYAAGCDQKEPIKNSYRRRVEKMLKGGKDLRRKLANWAESPVLFEVEQILHRIAEDKRSFLA